MDLFTDFTTLRWVKWTERKPSTNGRYDIRYNGKNKGVGTFIGGKLRRLDVLTEADIKNYEDTFYWLEEIIDVEGFAAAQEQEWMNAPMGKMH